MTRAGTLGSGEHDAPYVCEYDYFGCTDPSADNFISWATISWPSMCQFGGCNDTDAKNYDSHSTFNDGTCQYYKIGCTVRNDK